MIQIELETLWKQGKSGNVVISPNGDRQRQTTDGQKIKMTNIFDEFTGEIASSPDHLLLDRIVIVDRSGVKARYERGASGWERKP